MKAKPKRSKENESLSPEERKLVNAFYQAREATASPDGVTVDIEAIARKAIGAYWEAKSAEPMDNPNPVISPLEPRFHRAHVARAVMARIDPVRTFLRGILSSALPAAAAFALVMLGYAVIKRDPAASLTRALYVLPGFLLIAAIGLLVLFVLRRQDLLASKWVVLQTSSGSLVGGLLVAAIASWFGISMINQKMRADQYKNEVQLEDAMTELQPIAAQALSVQQNSGQQLQQDFDSKLQASQLAKRADIKKVVATNNTEVATYTIYFYVHSAESPPLDVVVKPDRIEIGRPNEPGYVMLKDSISDVSADTFTLFSRAESESSASIPLIGWDKSKTNEIKGSKVMVTYDAVLKKPVGVSLLDRPGLTNIYAAQNLDARIDRLALGKTAKAF